MSNFKSTVLVSGLVAVSIGLVGCGGGSAGEAAAHAPTVKLTDADNNKTKQVATVAKDPTSYLQSFATAMGGDNLIRSTKKKERLYFGQKEGIDRCGPYPTDGNKTIKVTAGAYPKADINSTGSFTEETTYDECRQGGGSYVVNGMHTNVENFDFNGTMNQASNSAITFDGISFKVDDTHKFVYSTGSVDNVSSHTYAAYAYKYTKNYSGKLTLGNRTIELDKVKESSDNNGTLKKYSISGSVNDSDVGGWVSIATPTAVEHSYMNNCPTKGEITVTGTDSTVFSVTFNSDESVDVKFNSNPATHYDTCDDYYNE